MTKTDPESLFANPFNDNRTDGPPAALDEASRHLARYSQDIHDAAQEVSNLSRDSRLPTEEEAVERAIFDISRAYAADATRESEAMNRSSQSERDFIVSFRASFQGFVLSLIDNAPSEICVISLRNLNALASWNTQRTTASTIYLTITSLQGERDEFIVLQPRFDAFILTLLFAVDNMIPNAPFPVAVSPYDSSRDRTPRTDTSAANASQHGADDATPPLLVAGISFAPRHRSGIVVGRVRFVHLTILLWSHHCLISSAFGL
jgi:hypothetical protein